MLHAYVYFRIMSNFGKQWETDKEKFNEATDVSERERTKLRVLFSYRVDTASFHSTAGDWKKL